MEYCFEMVGKRQSIDLYYIGRKNWARVWGEDKYRNSQKKFEKKELFIYYI